MGIYDKTCPQCMESSSAARVRCTCGYLFDASANDDRSLTLERIAREEKLFEEYLEARLAQAREAANVAAHAAQLDPEDQRKAVEALRTKQAVEKAATGLATQRIKAVQAAHAAGVAFAMRGSLMLDGAGNAKPLSVAQPSAAAQPTMPVDSADVSPAVPLRRTERWVPKHVNKRTMPPLRANNGAPHTQTGISRFAAAAGGTTSLSLPFAGSDAHRASVVKPPIPVLTTAVPQQLLPPIAVYNSGGRAFESKMVFDGSPWRDAAKKMAARAARHAASAAARGAKKAAKGIGRAAARGAKKAGRAAARGATKAARHVASAAAHTAKKAAHAVQQQREAMKVRATRMSLTFSGPAATTRLPTLTAPSPKPVVNAGVRQAVAPKPPIKPASAPKSTPAITASPTTRGQSQARAHIPAPKSVPPIAQRIEPRQRPQPTESFRAAQAAKIERAVTAARQLERKLPPIDIECPLCSATLSANAERCLCGWRIPNHEREIPALKVGTGKPNIRNGNELTVVFCPIECPLCTATLAANATRCRCGWRVPEGVNELPPVALSSEEISALSQGVQLDELGKAR